MVRGQTMKSLNKFAGIVLAAGFALSGAAASASHLSHLHEIDEIDHVFNAGGGTVSGGLSSGTDDGWLVFHANAGDILSINVQISNWYANVVLLQDTEDGNFQVGDGSHVTDFDSNQIGNGDPLEVIAHIGDVEFSSSSEGVLDGFVASYTGQYGIGINSANENTGFDWTVSVSGNTAGPGAPVTPVPLPASALILLSGLGAFRLVSKRKS